jgi:hypothetical protein
VSVVGHDEPGKEMLAEERIDGPFFGGCGAEEEELLDCGGGVYAGMEGAGDELGTEEVVDGVELNEYCFEKFGSREDAFACGCHVLLVF